MGVDYSSSLCVGVRMSDVFKIETNTETITKFNPDTGVPYQTQINKDRLMFFGRELAEEPQEYYPPEWVKDLAPGLDAYTTGNSCYLDDKKGFSRFDYKQIVIGKHLSGTKSHRSHDYENVLELTPKQINDALTEVKEILTKLGYSGEVSVFLLNYVSY